MLRLHHARDPAYLAHLEEARRVLALPVEASGLHWHPFGVFAIPLARRVVDGAVWSRRLHLWHPEATPVGETSPYGVHTHSGTATSHVLAGTLHHHLYAFREEEDGNWRQASRAGETRAVLRDHVEGATDEGMLHTLPGNQAHGVSKPPGFAISLFEQLEEGRRDPFTTWQRLDAPAEALVTRAPVDLKRVLKEARGLIEEAIYVVR
jgi:hypothetical protein